MKSEQGEESFFSQLAVMFSAAHSIVNNYYSLIHLKLILIQKSIITIIWFMMLTFIFVLSAWLLICYELSMMLAHFGFNFFLAITTMLAAHFILIGICIYMINSYRRNLNLTVLVDDELILQGEKQNDL